MRFETPRRGLGVVCAFAFAATLVASSARAATISVPAGGDLQAALNAAQAGDVITLEPGATYVGNFVLPNKSGLTTPIVVRSAAPDSSLPGPAVRMTPAYASLLPKIKSPNNMSALHTATAAHHWTLMFLEFQNNVNGYGDIIALGAGDSTQTQLSQVPYALVIDRVYVHGDPVLGQKRGIALHSSDTIIKNSYISDCKAIGQDSQAIFGFNGPGNYLIENNYLEAAAENFLLGGADPTIFNLVTTNVTFRRNYLSKPLEWRNPIIATPASVAASPVPGGGSLPAGTYYYKVVARRLAGQTNKANSIPTQEVSATLSTSGAVTISWSAVSDAEDYVIFGRTAGGENMYWKSTALFFTDSGATGTSGTPSSSGTRWSVKNLFELKNAQDVLVESNLMENLWVADQPGYAIVFTPRNQSGTAPWVVVQRVTFRNNLVRHIAGGVNILGLDDVAPSQRTNHITIQNNVFDDMTPATWGSGARFLQLGDGPDSITVDHNTVMTTTSAVVWMYGGSASSPTQIPRFVYTNNMSRHNSYGIMGSNYSPGLSSINAYMSDSIVRRNVLADGSASKYPTDNFFPTSTDWQNGFVSYAGGDYRLATSSPLKGAGTDGADVGANIQAIQDQTAIALSGNNTAPTATTQVQILTNALPNGTYGQPYAQTLSCSGAAGGSCAWNVLDLSLAPGLTFDPVAAVISGTPTGVGTGTLTVQAYDPSSPTSSTTKTLSLTVDAPPFSMTVAASASGQVGLPFQLTPTTSGAMASVFWTISSGTLPAGLVLDGISGSVSGTPAAWGMSSFVLQVQDSYAAGRTDSKAVTLTIAPAALSIATTSLPAGTVNAAYTSTLTATGGTGATMWSLASGALPAGVTLDANGVLAGTPITSGTFNFVLSAVDAGWPGNTAAQALSLTVAAAPVTAAPKTSTGVNLEVVLYASKATTVVGAWSNVADATAAGGYRVANPDLGAAKLTTPSATPASYFELSFVADANTPYHLWLRGKAQADSWANDSVYVQFSGTVDATGAPVYRIGTTTGTPVVLEDAMDAGVAGWGWQDNAYGAFAEPLYFGTSGLQTLRIQVREDGLSIDQIVLSSSKYASSSPGALKNDATILAETQTVTPREVVLYASQPTKVAGKWSNVADATAANGLRMSNPNLNAPKKNASAAPADYFELKFTAEASVPYHLWIRGKAENNSYDNDSVYVQFSGSVDAKGSRMYRIGTTKATSITIEDSPNAGVSGWGWQDNAYAALAAPIYFEQSGEQTIRFQVRENGLSIDQIVLSSSKYLMTSPGALKNDTVILNKTQ